MSMNCIVTVYERMIQKDCKSVESVNEPINLHKGVSEFNAKSIGTPRIGVPRDAHWNFT